jgi:hypothetical protein
MQGRRRGPLPAGARTQAPLGQWRWRQGRYGVRGADRREDSATTGTLSLGYTLSKALEFSASAEYGVTPEMEHEAGFLLALTWRYDAATKKGGTP